MTSIRRRLLVGLLTALTMLWLVTAAYVYHDAQRQVERLFDAHLAQYSRILLALVARAAEENDLSALQHMFPFMPESYVSEDTFDGGAGSSVADTEYQRKLAFQIWATDGTLLLRSHDTPTFLNPPHIPGFNDERIGKHEWRIYNLIDTYHKISIRVAERDDVRGELIRKILRRQLAPGVFALPLLGLIIWFVVGSGLRPLKRVAGEVQNRAPQQLSPVTTSGVPTEIQPLVHSLNELFARLNAAFERERRFTADAAHELRTPLAALKTQAQVALTSVDEGSKQRALNQIVRGVDRATRLVEQLLTIARLEPDTEANSPSQPLDLCRCVREVVAELAPPALLKHIELAVNTSPCEHTVLIMGNPVTLSVLLRNLVENAIRYTPEAGHVTVEIKDDSQGPSVGVTDTGPGIPEEEQGRVFDRFYRGLGHKAPGSGLGLSIVHRIAEQHRATLSLENVSRKGGLRVTIRFPGTDN